MKIGIDVVQSHRVLPAGKANDDPVSRSVGQRHGPVNVISRIARNAT